MMKSVQHMRLYLYFCVNTRNSVRRKRFAIGDAAVWHAIKGIQMGNPGIQPQRLDCRIFSILAFCFYCYSHCLLLIVNARQWNYAECTMEDVNDRGWSSLGIFLVEVFVKGELVNTYMHCKDVLIMANELLMWWWVTAKWEIGLWASSLHISNFIYAYFDLDECQDI